MKKLVFNYLEQCWHHASKDNNDILISLVNTSSKATVLDIGVFRGDLAIDRFKNIKKPTIYAIDIDQEAIKSAKSLGIKAINHNVEKELPYKSNFFDIVSANQIIEHLTDTDLFIKEIYRVLKPKGYLILSTENLSSWHNLFAIFLGWQAFSQHISYNKSLGNPLRHPHHDDETDRDFHNKIFTPRGLKELVEFYDLKLDRFFGAGYYPFPKNLSKALSRWDPTHSAFIGLKAIKPK